MISALWNRLSSRLDHLLWTQQWFLLYRAGESESRTLSGFQAITQPRNALWADPFLVETGNRHYVFFEELRYRFWGRSTGSHGRLCGMEYLGENQWGSPFPILERDYHLSYPFIFGYRGRHYMIPETLGNGTIELYRATGFPHKWRLSRTILTGVQAVDTTLCEHNGKWWMFTCLQHPQNGPPNRDLHIYFADDPVDGVWQPHPANPVVSDLRYARAAGRIISRGGELYRPAQDCSRDYGAAIEWRKITRLDEGAYSEIPVERMTAEGLPGAAGVHTWNQTSWLTVIDARRKVGRWSLCQLM